VESKQKNSARRMIRNFLIEVAAYGALLVAYFFFALRYLGEPLQRIYETDLKSYALWGTILIVVQAVVLDQVVGFLVDFFKLHQTDG